MKRKVQQGLLGLSEKANTIYIDSIIYFLYQLYSDIIIQKYMMAKIRVIPPPPTALYV